MAILSGQLTKSQHCNIQQLNFQVALQSQMPQQLQSRDCSSLHHILKASTWQQTFQHAEPHYSTIIIKTLANHCEQKIILNAFHPALLRMFLALVTNIIAIYLFFGKLYQNITHASTEHGVAITRDGTFVHTCTGDHENPPMPPTE